jgi:1-acyl-sn-glycerol-3-phosphate acyltransferase
VNRIIIIGSLLLLLPSIVIAEKLHRGKGRALAHRGAVAVARLCGVTFDVRGVARGSVDGTTVLVPNHSSPLDIPAMMVAVPDVRFVAASGLFRIPLLASAMRALGVVALDRRHPDHAWRQLDALADTASSGESCQPLVIFPEGGIAPAGARLPFKTGAFSLAIAVGGTVVPVAIRGSDRLLPPGGRLALSPGTVTIELLSPLATDGMTATDRHALGRQAQELVESATRAAAD